MKVEWVRSRSLEYVCLSGEGQNGTPGQQLEHLFKECSEIIESYGLTMPDAIFHRLWLRSRSAREEVADARSKLFTGPCRTASSSFFSQGRFAGQGDVALELIALSDKSARPKRVVEFSPARRYAHYACRGQALFMSGMAEEGPTLQKQFDLAFQQVEAGLSAEGLHWRHVSKAHFFLERSKAELSWLRQAFEVALGQTMPDQVTYEYVDALASPGKHLEIEVVAALEQ